MQLYASKYIRFLYIIIFLDSLLEGLQGFLILKQIVSLNIGVKNIISEYNQGHIIRELRTRDRDMPTLVIGVVVIDVLPPSGKTMIAFPNEEHLQNVQDPNPP
jgi:hypothetical protein